MDEKDINNVVTQIKNKQKDLDILQAATVMDLKNNTNLSNLEKQVIQDISVEIIRKTKSTSSFLISDYDSILQNAVSLRYILEILITIIFVNCNNKLNTFNQAA